ncbi:MULTISPECIES: type 1 periplasmic binding fold superfamily protein [Roseivirga]|jgi:hypothetical protein|uniref:Type 1 periplasmic binding fold superfamily protein n=1 Tax=Roseivirga thermotolerans TaxID=1758176 RepID=A0ABQ3I5L4_9BACT|nr:MULTISPECIES: type 1 periplasmic binding fold superfamily protein [Roseivirga]MEC7755081.1 type 1 periplasmic binding fold superfamily protein [Bacteroidota bacterium]GHE56357.1 hypothetical protein GCM10011340_09090 [Roseivirga thermotolerans]|tara:strand:+ start:98 stop:673 length:576 start_codon:yes stop_codon:yes gene_type:complete
MKKLIKLNWLLVALLATVSLGCDKDDPDPVNEEELITKVELTFTSTGPINETIVASWEDTDGDGGSDPVIDDIVLTESNTYDLTLAFFNGAVNITPEIKAEARDHQLFFEISSSLTLLVEYNDTETDYTIDGQDYPVGLKNNASAGNASTGTLTVILVHEPAKFQTGVAEGDQTNAGGEEDVRVTFNVTIQ